MGGLGLLCLLVALVGARAEWEESALVRTLMEQLKANMSQLTRPSLGGSPVQVEMAVDLLALQDFSKKDAVGKFYVEEQYLWHEPRIQWEPSEFPGIRHILLPADAAWTPDVFMENDLSLSPARLSGRLAVTWDGHIEWRPRAVHTAKCRPSKPLSRRNKSPDWHCHLVYTSHDYHQDELLLTHVRHDGLNMTSAEGHDDWILKRTGVKKLEPCCGREQAKIDYNLVLKEVPYVRPAMRRVG